MMDSESDVAALDLEGAAAALDSEAGAAVLDSEGTAAPVDSEGIFAPHVRRVGAPEGVVSDPTPSWHLPDKSSIGRCDVPDFTQMT